MQTTTEPLATVGMDLLDFVKSVPVSGPDGKQQPHKLDDALEGDILTLLACFTRADQYVSDKRTKIAFGLCKYVESNFGALACAFVDKLTDESSLALRKLKPQIDESLDKLKHDTKKNWDAATLTKPETIALLQSYDQTFGCKYSDPAKNLLRRIAVQFLNADGPSSKESQRVFDNYQRVLETPAVATGRFTPNKTQNEVLESLLSDCLALLNPLPPSMVTGKRRLQGQMGN